MEKEDLKTWMRQHYSKRFFTFPDMPSTKELQFEKLSTKNFEQLYLLFENDASPFVDERFKTYEGAKEYAAYLEEFGARLPKHGGQDWLFRLLNGEYAGILHLYDLSLETFVQNHKRAWIGFATKEKFRKQNITTKAVQHFIDYIFQFYPEIDFIHAMTEKENEASIRFLLKCGFQFDPEERLSKKYEFFILFRPVLS